MTFTLNPFNQSANETRGAVVDAYAQYIEDQIDKGRKGYLMTFTFDNLPGGIIARIGRMKDEVDRVFSTFVTHVKRKSKRANIDELPILIGCPERGVVKEEKKDVKSMLFLPNDGWHVHGILLVPRDSRLETGAKRHFCREEARYIKREKPLERIYLKRIRETPQKATKYALKGFLREWVDGESIIVLPKVRSEME